MLNMTQNISYLLIFFVGIVSSMPLFGMNKPHMLFHLGDRQPISLNIGWGYWTMDNKMRLAYQNTNNGLYVNVKTHNGENMMQEQIQDRSGKIDSNIKYQLFQNNYWQTQIEMQSQLSGSDNRLETDWFMYASIENNDYRSVNHQNYSTFTYLIPNILQEDKKVQISTQSIIAAPQKLTFNIEDSTDVKIFGLTANTSQTFNIKGIAEQFKHLVELSQKKNVTRKNQKQIVEWQNKQVFLMEDQQNFLNKSFVVVFVYGKFKKSTQIHLTNSTQQNKQFNIQAFQQKQQRFDQKLSNQKILNEQQLFIKHVVSNLYGGITYYFGRLYTQNSLMAHSHDYCYSFTPSRLIFPRSFLWDDGFHQAVAINYNPELVMDVISSWLNKIDSFGWIGRQQIRGSEINAMMPDSTFVFQDWFQMNPPTLMLTFLKFMQVSQTNPHIKSQFDNLLSRKFYKLEEWYHYFKSTQSHETLQYNEIRNASQIFYRWQCKDQCKKGNFMGSGLDDYPRRLKQTQISKQHVDVISWLYFFSDTLLQLSQYLQKQNIAGRHSKRRINYFKNQNTKYIEKLYAQFFDSSDNLFKDTVVEEKDAFIQSFVDKIGYINLFPFFTGMLKSGTYSSQQKRITAIKKIIQIMSDQKLLLSKDGLRSLSISDPLYGTDDNYWRGAIWLPINYMVLRACKVYYWDQQYLKSQIRDFYKILRDNLIETVTKNYKDTGYLFQNYYEGKGHRGFPFYGWTSLIANIISEKY